VIAATIACAIGLAMLLAGEHRRRQLPRCAGKVVASAAFLVVAMLARPDSAFDTWIMVGLVLGAIGDVALLARRGFLVGLVAFLLGHLAYVVGVHHELPASAWLGAAGIAAIVPAAVALAALALLWPRLGSMRGPVIAYVVVITAMVIAALALARADVIAARRAHRFLAGAVLFFASDLSVARDKFIAPTFANKAWGLPAYYAGQLLIAWSLEP
jgi:uncharacterized membrane protein YhhN